ncbi:M48 family metalloprotease [Phytoactinopolyspora halotolerans]|uniref:M48 family metalloprotease n=1 Tax=Phytoactinopolyspora halotolerans TaxID=1981512 RepID=A0A6L9SC31_9ACTN|nr:M48 family metalloprotease [Phytoactinopolyspora halotolerans]NEE02121.1 M48 family metalloprotease [Phytoactinopolyspora halotolerans]
MTTGRFQPDRRLTIRIAETWVLLLLITAGYGALIGLGLQHLWGWPWWIGLFLPALAVVAYRGEDGGVLPKHLTVLDADEFQYSELHAAIDRLCALSNTPMPRVKIIDTEWPNALTLQVPGRRPVIAITWGLLATTEEAELEAVLAHELAHILHRDAKLMTFATQISTSLLTLWIYVADVFNVADEALCRRARRCGHGWQALFADDSAAETKTAMRQALLDWTVVPLIGFLRAIAILLFFPLILVAFVAMLPPALPVTVVLTRLGRYREYAADRTAAMMTAQPAALAAALTRLSGHMPAFPKKELRNLNTLSSMSIMPLPDEKTGKQTHDIVDRVLGWHPPVQKRIDRLADLTRDLAQ